MGKKKAVTAADAKKKAAKKAKVEKKAEKRDTKTVKKAKGEKNEEEDLDAILLELAREWDAKHKVNDEIVSGAPSKRANATLTPCPVGSHLWFIGGEWFSDDGKAYFYNDVYRYSPEKDEWRCYSSPTAPGPRSAHSVVASPAGGGKLFLFGGEFSSLHQNTFHHYRDFWEFTITTMSWERIETKVKPIARSGHRMAIWKHFIVLCGGFVDVANYLNDVWLFSLEDYKWEQVEFPPHQQQPSPRSGFSFLSTPDGVVLHGGYYKDYIKGKRPIGIALDDTWFLKMSLERKDIKWEKRKKIGYAPNPPRSGCTMALWPAKSQGIMFGGVSDVDKDEEVLESVFFNDMYAYQTAGTGRWTSLNMRAKKKKAGVAKKPKPAVAPQASRFPVNDNDVAEEMDVDQEEWTGIELTATPVATASSVAATTDGLVSSTQELDINRSDDTSGPFLRYNAMLAVLKHTLYMHLRGYLRKRIEGVQSVEQHVFTIEVESTYQLWAHPLALDDFWALQLDKMDSFTCLRPLDTAVHTGEGAESSDDDEDNDDDDDDEDDDDGNREEEDDEEDEGNEPDEDNEPDEEGKVESADVNMAEETPALSKEELLALRAKAQDFLGSTKDANLSAEDQISTPLPGESLATFYARSKDYWAQRAHETSDNRGKLLRRDGFGLAEDRYATYKPILDEVEKILAEAGLDDEEMKRVGASGNVPGSSANRNRR